MRYRYVSFAISIAFMILLSSPDAGRAAVAAGTEEASRSASNRQFFAFYQIVETTGSGEEVKVVLRLNLYNHGDNDLRIAYAALATPSPVEGNWKSLIGIEVDRHSSRTITEEFTVPRRELERWEKTAPPKLVLSSVTGTSERHTETILLDSRTREEN